VILAAGLLVLLGLGLFVGGVLTGITALYWSCVGACAVAAVLLIASRRQTAAKPAGASGSTAARTSTPTTPTGASSPSAGTARAGTSDRTSDRDGTPEPVGVEAAEEAPAAAASAPPGAQATAHRTGAGVSPGATEGSAATGAPAAAPGTGAHAAARAHRDPARMEEPGVEEVEVTDLLLVVDLTDEVLVVDEHPRYHLEGCRYLTGRETIPLPLDEARTDGFTPCALCAPDRHLADRERARKAAR
jgi:hypothetical protein